MKKLMLIASSAAALALSGCIAIDGDTITAPAAASVAASPAQDAERSALVAQQTAGRYVVEPNHTSIVWRVSHLGVSNYTARFDKVSGTLDVNVQKPELSSVDITIDANSISTGLPNFNTEIANQALKAEANPTMRFVSTGLVMTGPDRGNLTGNFTMAGQTHPVTLAVQFINGRNYPFGPARRLIGFTASGNLNRSDWGVDNWGMFVGDNVSFEINAEFLQDIG